MDCAGFVGFLADVFVSRQFPFGGRCQAVLCCAVQVLLSRACPSFRTRSMPMSTQLRDTSWASSQTARRCWAWEILDHWQVSCEALSGVVGDLYLWVCPGCSSRPLRCAWRCVQPPGMPSLDAREWCRSQHRVQQLRVHTGAVSQPACDVLCCVLQASQ